MRRFVKSSFLWQFAGGFAFGAIGLVAFHAPVSAQDASAPVAVSATQR